MLYYFWPELRYFQWGRFLTSFGLSTLRHCKLQHNSNLPPNCTVSDIDRSSTTFRTDKHSEKTEKCPSFSWHLILRCSNPLNSANKSSYLPKRVLLVTEPPSALLRTQVATTLQYFEPDESSQHHHILRHHHHHHRLYSPGWALASSSKCRQRHLSWATTSQFLQSSFFASSSTPPKSWFRSATSSLTSRVCPQYLFRQFVFVHSHNMDRPLSLLDVITRSVFGSL